MRFFRAPQGASYARGRVGAVVGVVALRSLALGVNVCTGVLTAAFLGPDGRGELAAFTLAPQFLAGLAAFGLHASFIYNSKADPRHEREYLGANLVMLCLTGAAFAALGWAVLPHWLSRHDPQTVALARAFLLTVPVGAMTMALLTAAEARGRFGLANGLVYLQSFCTLAALLALVGLDLLTPATAAAAYLLPPVLAFVCFACSIGREVKPLPTLRAPFPGRLLRYGVRFYGFDLLGTLSGYLDQLVLVALLEPAAVGIYAVALSLARMLNVLQGAICSVLFPSIAARGTAEVVGTVGATLGAAVPITAAVALAAGLAGPVMLELLYGPRFAPAVGIFRLLLLDAVAASAARILFQAYSGSGRPGWVTGFEAAGTVASLASMVVLVPRFGLQGMAWSVIVGSVVRLACGVAALRPALGEGMPGLLLRRSDVRIWFRAARGPAAVEDAVP